MGGPSSLPSIATIVTAVVTAVTAVVAVASVAVTVAIVAVVIVVDIVVNPFFLLLLPLPLPSSGCFDGWGFTGAYSVSASFYCTSKYHLPADLLAITRNKHRGTFEFRWRCGVPLSVLKKLNVDDAWMIWGAGAYGEPDLLPLTVEFGAKYNLGGAMASKSGKGGGLLSGVLTAASYLPNALLSGVSSMASSVTSGSCLTDICVYNYTTPAVQISSTLHYNAGMKAFQQQPWCALIDQQSCVWTQADSLPRVHASGGLVMSIYNPDFTVRQLPGSKKRSMAWIPLAQFDSWTKVSDQSKNTWVIGRKKLCTTGQACCSKENECAPYLEAFNQDPDCGTCPDSDMEGFIAICSAVPLNLPGSDVLLTRNPPCRETVADNMWVAEGWKNIFVCRVGWSGDAAAPEDGTANLPDKVDNDLTKYDSYDAFRATVEACSTQFTGITNDDPLKVVMQDPRLKRVEAGYEGDLNIEDEAVNQKIDFSYPELAAAFR